MTSRYEDNLNLIKAWVELVNYHWDRLEGELFNDSLFWQETLESMSDNDWWAWVDIAPALKIQYNEQWRRYPRLDIATEEIKKLLMLGKPVTKKSRKGKNFEAFRLLMNIKDFVNDINETPTKTYTKPKVTTEVTEDYTRVTIWHNLFDLDD